MYQLLIKHQRRLFGIFFFILLSHAAITTLYASVVQFLTNYAMGKIQVKLYWLALFCSFFAIIAAIVNVLGGYLKGCVSNDAMLWLRRSMFQRLTNRSVEQFQQDTVGAKVAYFTNKLDLVQQNYVNSFLDGLSLLFQFVFAITFGLMLDVRLTTLILLLEIPSFLLPIWARHYLQNVKEPILISLESYTSKLTNWLSGFSTIKNFGRDLVFSKMHQEAAVEVRDAENRDILIRKIVSGLSQFFGDLVYFGTWVIGAYFIRQQRIDMASFLAFTQLAVSISFPIESSADVLADFFGGQKIYREFQNLLKDQDALKKDSVTAESNRPSKFINYRHVDIGPVSKPILKDVNLNIDQTEKVVLIGESGSGKSTLVNTMFGYHEISRGELMIAGRDIKTMASTYVPSLIGFQNQNTFIFNGTVWDNITMFESNYSLVDVIAALKRVDLDIPEHNVKQWLQQRIETHGSVFSGGERQRLGLARNLLAHKQFMIFDELSSGLDHETATRLEDDLFSITDVGFIYITHNYDRDLLNKADRILMVKNGQIIEENSLVIKKSQIS
ncbi:ATP-binding cassette domain-containing protein [Lapidilactobacillus bayanensis]|uniref:ATP-binding cassette domain-containing protein n=1 Tax=Lapidilactobacillus bayanensis TaxID=2485998 RepID=UPI000F76DF1D|nr:ABC transporter ATP-binding protein [Lapidilactobacillus bayanensis]